MTEKIDVKNLTWQQVTICCALLVAVIGAYKLFGEIPAGVLLVISSIVNLLLGRAPGASGKADS
jgi:Na+/H+ antiporter NhaC